MVASRRPDLQEALRGPSPDDMRAHVERHTLNPLRGCALCDREASAQSFLSSLRADRVAQMAQAYHDDHGILFARRILALLGARPLLKRRDSDVHGR